MTSLPSHGWNVSHTWAFIYIGASFNSLGRHSLFIYLYNT